MITSSTLSSAAAQAHTADLRRHAARMREVQDMQTELDALGRPRPRATRFVFVGAGVVRFAASRF